MSNEEFLSAYIIIEAHVSKVYAKPNTEQCRNIVYFFGIPFEEIKLSLKLEINSGWYEIPTYLFFEKLKEPVCEYELVGMTGDDYRRTYLHLLKKKHITDNID